MTDQPRWMNDAEQRVWRDFQRLQARVHRAIQQDLHANPDPASRLSEPEYEVLVHLSEADHPLRLGELAGLLQWEQSRVSHLVRRMEGRDLVARTGCPSDRRGALVQITRHGLSAIVAAAPGHVETARRELIDRIPPEDWPTFARVLRRLVDEPTSPPNPSEPGPTTVEGCSPRTRA